MQTQYEILLAVGMALVAAVSAPAVPPKPVDATVVTLLPSDGMPEGLQKLVAAFDTKVAKANSDADTKRAELNQQMEEGLEKAIAKAQSSGDINAVLALKAAREDFDTLTTSDVPLVKNAIGFREKKTMEIETTRVADAMKAAKEFNEELEKAKKDETVKGNFEEAKIILDRQQALKNWANELRLTTVPSSADNTSISQKPSNQQTGTDPGFNNAKNNSESLVQDDNSVEDIAQRIVANGVVQGQTREYMAGADNRGRVKLTFPENRGKAILKNSETEFLTMWSPCGDNSVYAYKDYVKLLGFNDDCHSIPASIKSFEKGWDFSTRSHTIASGHVFALINNDNRFVAIKVLSVKDKSRGAKNDEIIIEFKIY